MNDVIPIDIEARLLKLLADSGLQDTVGGLPAIREGVRQMKVGLLQVASDLIAVDERGEALSLAVFDAVRYPHLASFHGFVSDLLHLEVPTDLQPWATRIVEAGPAPDAPEVRRWLTHLALRADNQVHRVLGRLMLFESFCLNQRAHIRAARVRLEVVGGHRADVEAVAEVELLTLLGESEYAEAVLELEDPWPSLMGAALISLNRHEQELRDQVAQVGSDVHAQLELRRHLLEALDGLPDVDAVLLRNVYASEFGEERITVEHLQTLHPTLLGGMKRNTLDQRLKRLLARRERLLEPSKERGVSLLDLLISKPVGLPA